MLGTKYSKTNRLQMTIEYKKIQNAKYCIVYKIQKITNQVRLVLIDFASTILTLNYTTQVQCN